METTVSDTRGSAASVPAARPYSEHKAEALVGAPLNKIDAFLTRWIQGIASSIATLSFLLISSVCLFLWFFVNGVTGFIDTTITALGHGGKFDPPPWILLNLIFSAQAFYTGSFTGILMKKQLSDDRVSEDAAAAHREEQHTEVVTLIGQNTDLTEATHANTQLIRLLAHKAGITDAEMAAAIADKAEPGTPEQ